MVWLAQGWGRGDFSSRACVFFDFDGTVANTVDGIKRTARDTLLARGLSDEEIGDVGRVIGPAFPGAFEQVYGMSAEEAQAVTEDYRRRYDLLGPGAYAAYGGVPELLERLRGAGRWLCLTTSKRQDLVTRQATENGLVGLFDRVIGQRGPGHDTKPLLVRESIEAAGGDPARCVMVGDRFHDAEGAEENGIPCVGVTWGAGTADELAAAGAAALVDTPGELAALLLGERDMTVSPLARPLR